MRYDHTGINIRCGRSKVRNMAKDFVTLIVITPVGIPDRIPLSCRIERMISEVKYSYLTYPTFVFDRPTRVGFPRTGYPPG